MLEKKYHRARQTKRINDGRREGEKIKDEKCKGMARPLKAAQRIRA
jgi:hypothetical protein